MNALLVAVLAVPALGAAIVPWLRGAAAKTVALVASGATFVMSLALLAGRHEARAVVDPWHSVDVAWIPTLGVRFQLGVDGMSWPLVALTALLTLLCVVSLRASVRNRSALLALILALEVGMLGTFLALDLLLFFLFFELTLAPMYAVIAGWGGARRAAAAKKFVLYTLLGSVLLLVGIAVIAFTAHTTDIATIASWEGTRFSRGVQRTAFFLLLLAFAIKSPLWPLHSWLPDAHTEAPTVGSVLLAGVMLKMGTYGLLRVCVSAVPDAARAWSSLLAVLAVAAICWAGLVCLRQTDLKRLIAYSSVGHMGFVLLGVATFRDAGVQAALVGNIAHGVITGLLFFLVGAVKERYGTGDLRELGDLRAAQPRLAGLLGFAAVASFGLPGLAGFWGEAFAVFATFGDFVMRNETLWRTLGVLAAVGAVLAVAYMLRMLRLVVTAPRAHTKELAPLRPSEVLAWAPLVALTLLIGVWPDAVLAPSLGPASQLVEAVSVW